MPCTLDVLDFQCVRSSVLKQIQGLASDPGSTGYLYLTPQNLHYMFCEYVRRFEQETGWVLDADTYALDVFSRLIYELYYDGMCKYGSWDPRYPPTRLEDAQRVAEWTEESIRAIVFQALKEARKKTNYLTRYRDPTYGRKMWDPITVTKPGATRRENGYRYNFTQIGATNYRYPVIDDC